MILPETIDGNVREVQAGSISLDAVLADLKDRLAAWSDLNVFITLMIDDARVEGARRPLAGVPVGAKDFFDTAGVRTTAGDARLATRVPARDARLVRLLRAAGAMLVGKTNMHAMGIGTTGLDSHFGPVWNPWDASLVPVARR